MATNKISLTVFAALLLAATTTAAPVRVTTFTEATAAAKDSQRPVAVYIHGSSWHKASRLFAEKIWNSPDFLEGLHHEVLLTDIHVQQHLEPEAAKKAAESHQGWNKKTVRSYPALQIYAADGRLLNTSQGSEFRVLTSPADLAAHLNTLLHAAKQRRELLTKIATARESNDQSTVTDLLIQLIELPIANEPNIIDQLKAADPEDKSGWQARLSFKNWDFVRHITGLINGGKIDEALLETATLLETSRFTPEQRTLILGARGKALAASGDLNAAWEAFQEAKRTDPDGPNGKAIWRYGVRTVGTPLRVILPPESTLSNKDIGDNLSRDDATYTLSSSSSDDPTHHPSLFRGPSSPTGFAFHTDREKDAHIIIDLQAACKVRALRITNRKSSAQRAESLTLWTSTDGTEWTKSWSATEVQPAWDILLEPAATARFLKLGLNRDTPEHFHLLAVDIYGDRPDQVPASTKTGAEGRSR